MLSNNQEVKFWQFIYFIHYGIKDKLSYPLTLGYRDWLSQYH